MTVSRGKVCKLRDRSRPGAEVKVGQPVDAIAATFPSEALGGRDATAHGTEHDPPAAQAGEEPARDRAGVGAESGDGGPSAGRAGRAGPAGATAVEADRSVPRADRGLGDGGPDGGADVRTGPRSSRMPAWLPRWSTASCTTVTSSTSRAPRGGSRGAHPTTRAPRRRRLAMRDTPSRNDDRVLSERRIACQSPPRLPTVSPTLLSDACRQQLACPPPVARSSPSHPARPPGHRLRVPRVRDPLPRHPTLPRLPPVLPTHRPRRRLPPLRRNRRPRRPRLQPRRDEQPITRQLDRHTHPHGADLSAHFYLGVWPTCSHHPRPPRDRRLVHVQPHILPIPTTRVPLRSPFAILGHGRLLSCVALRLGHTRSVTYGPRAVSRSFHCVYESGAGGRISATSTRLASEAAAPTWNADVYEPVRSTSSPKIGGRIMIPR